MKVLKTISALVLLLFIISCSSDGSDSDEISNKDSFNYKYENESVNINSWQAVKSENTIAISGTGDAGEVVFFQFNVFGNLSSVTVLTGETDDVGFQKSYYSYEYFKSNYFNFDLVGIDEANKRVSVKFSGDLYEEEYDIDSESRNIEGSFNVKYTEVTPQISGLEVSAKINGDSWYSTSTFLSAGSSTSPLSLIHYSDDENFISYTIYPNEVNTGTYQFDQNSTVYKIDFSQYDPITNDFINYETTGVFTIDEYNVGFGISQIKGTFSLIAKNEDEVITITEGKINDVYSY